jgi:DNA-binding FadR family transcriptional regulator
MTHNRVLVILSNSVMRFLAERGPRRELSDQSADRRKLRTLLQRLAVAVAARDAETAARSGRELLRRLTKLLEAGFRP